MDFSKLLTNLPKPIPSMGVEAYLEEKNRSINFSERRKNNYQKYLASDRTGSIDYLPVKLDIENVDEYKGLGFRSPIYSSLMVLFLVSLTKITGI